MKAGNVHHAVSVRCVAMLVLLGASGGRHHDAGFAPVKLEARSMGSDATGRCEPWDGQTSAASAGSCLTAWQEALQTKRPADNPPDTRGDTMEFRLKLRALVEQMNSDYEDERNSAEGKLGELGAKARRALPELYTALATKGPEIRINVLRVIGAIGGREAAPVLIRSLTTETDLRVRKAAVHGLSDLQPIPTNAIPALVKGMREAVALGDDHIFLEESPLLPPSRSEHFGDVCAFALVDIGADAVAAARELLRSQSPGERFVAVEILRRIGRASHPAVQQLATCLSDSDPLLRQSAARALGAIGRRAMPAVPALLKALRDPSWEPRLYAAVALKAIGVANEQANTALVQMTQDADPNCRFWALATIKDNSDEAGKFLPAVIAALDDPNSTARYSAVEALAAFGDRAKAGVPALVKLLKSIDNVDRSLAAAALARVRDSAVGVPALTEALRDSSPKVRLSAAEALGAYARSAKGAIPALEQVANEPGEVGAAAKKALVRIKWGI
jgi:HEAT repeat protein